MPFIGHVTLEPIKEAGTFDRELWRVVEPMIFRSARHAVVISVPPGFETDLASVPRLPIVYALTGGAAVCAAVVHDWLYRGNAVYLNERRQVLSRSMADEIFWEIMSETEVPAWRKALMWAGVRIGGWLAYGEER